MSPLQEYIGLISKFDKNAREIITQAIQNGNDTEVQLMMEHLVRLNKEKETLKSVITKQRAGIEVNYSSKMFDHNKVDKNPYLRKNITNEYPKFERNENLLVRIGYSKSRGSEYRISIEFKIVQKVLFILTEYYKNSDNPVKAEEIFDGLSDLKGEYGIHHVHHTLAWLTNLNLIEKMGHAGYILVKKNQSIKADANLLWNQMDKEIKKINN